METAHFPLPLGRKEVSRVMPQSPQTGKPEKRIGAWREDRDTLFLPLAPSLHPPPAPSVGRTGRQRMRLFAIFPRSASVSLSPGVFWCSIALCISSSCCVNLHHPSFLCFANLPFASLMSGLPGCLLHGSRLYAFQAL